MTVCVDRWLVVYLADDRVRKMQEDDEIFVWLSSALD